MTATIYLSDDAVRGHAIATGNLLTNAVELSVPLETMTPEEREEFLAITGLHQRVNLMCWAEDLGVSSSTSIDLLVRFNGRDFEVDDLPSTPADWLEIIRAYVAKRTAAAEQRRQDSEAFEAKRAKREHDQREHIQKIFSEVEALDDHFFRSRWGNFKTALEQAIAQLTDRSERATLEVRVQQYNTYAHELERRAERESLATYDARIEAMRQAESERRSKFEQFVHEIEPWARQYGTLMLNHALQAGEDPREMYAYERARLEHPQFTLDKYWDCHE